MPSDGPIGEDQLPLVAGQTVAFVDQGSASGYLIPSLQLSEAGVDPTTGIEATFAGSHDGSVMAVYNGDATVGVSFNDARTVVAEQFPDVGEQVVVFAWSSPIPNDGFAVAGDLPDDLKTAITDALLDIAGTEEGAAVLEDAVRDQRSRAGRPGRVRLHPRAAARCSPTSRSDRQVTATGRALHRAPDPSPLWSAVTPVPTTTREPEAP